MAERTAWPVDGAQPSAADVLAARTAAGLTQSQAAASVYLGHYKRWCEYENGASPMRPALFELFLVKHGLHPGFVAAA